MNEMNALLNRRCKVCIYTEVCMEGNCKNTDYGLPYLDILGVNVTTAKRVVYTTDER